MQAAQGSGFQYQGGHYGQHFAGLPSGGGNQGGGGFQGAGRIQGGGGIQGGGQSGGLNSKAQEIKRKLTEINEGLKKRTRR